jgi:hypothetical protein
MKNSIKIIFAFLLFLPLCAEAQQNEIPDYSKFESRVILPPGYSPSPLGTQSSVITSADGFDNYYLGVDFGEPYIAQNPKDPKNSVCAWNINELYYSLNGMDWIKKNVSFPGFSVIGDPVLAYDSLGNVYYSQLYQNGSTYGAAVAKSFDKGVNFTQFASACSFAGGLVDKEWITCDQTAGPYSNYVYMGWRQFGSTGMRFVRSTDGGVTWSSPLTLGGDQGAYVTVGANGSISGGNVYFGCTNSSTIRVYRSTDGGATFGSAVNAVTGIAGPGVICAGRYTMKSCIRTNFFPLMAADNSFTSTRGNLYVVYAANPAGIDLADIYMVKSTDYGSTWTSPVRINDDATTADQWMPAITVDKVTGKVFIFWYDSRIDPAGNLMTEIYGTHSTDGGNNFMPNYKISNASFNPNNMGVSQPGGEKYIGDYVGNASVNSVTSLNAWNDSRNNNMGSFVSYGPDFAMKTNTSLKYLPNNDSVTVGVSVPAVRGGFNERVKFTLSLDSVPASGNITFSFVNGRDSITAFPDSVFVKIKTVGSVTPKKYTVTILGSGKNGTPAHRRNIDIIVNSSYANIGTNREGICDFKINGIAYIIRQNILYPNGTTITVQAVSPKITGGTKYVYTNWSDNGDTTHNITVNSSVNLTANYKAQYKLQINSIVGNTFGGDLFYDSLQSFTFGVLSRQITFNGTPYRFRGWTGAGTGAYTSPDSTGNDSAVTLSLANAVVEIARWQAIVGVSNISSEIPYKYELYQNYPNPFNPVTKINFDIVKQSNVKIIVYDALGREIETLLNEELQPGKYYVDFNASKLASGLYFYRITAGDFSDVKRMIILK